MIKNPKISIIIIAYNIEKFIEQCIQSAVDQDYNNTEIIVIDDKSTDETGQICDSFIKKDNRIKIFHQKQNMGQSSARNLGLEHATGDYITFVDGDDWLAPDFVSYMLETILTFNADMAINTENFTSRDLNQVKTIRQAEKWSSEKATAELLFPHLTVGAWNKLYRKKFLDENKIQFKKLFNSEGDTFINDCAQRANHVAVGHKKVYYYRLNNTESATTKYDIRQSEGAIYASEEIRKNLIIKTPYVLNAMRRHEWINHFWNIRQILKLNLRREKNNEFKKSKRFIRKYATNVILHETSWKKKIFFTCYAMFPIISAKIKNHSFDRKLSKDVATFKKQRGTNA